MEGTNYLAGQPTRVLHLQLLTHGYWHLERHKKTSPVSLFIPLYCKGLFPTPGTAAEQDHWGNPRSDLATVARTRWTIGPPEGDRLDRGVVSVPNEETTILTVAKRPAFLSILPTC